MSSRSVFLLGPGTAGEACARIRSDTEALQVYVVNPGGGSGGDVNLAQYGGVAVGAGNALHVQPGTGAVFVVADGGGSLTVDGTVTANQGGSWLVDVVSVIPGTDPDQLGKASGDLFVAGATGVAFYGIDLTTAQWNPIALNNTRLAINLDDGSGTAQFLSVQRATDTYNAAADGGAVVAARVDTSTPSLATDTWDFLRLTAAGRLKTDVVGTVSITTGTAAGDLGKAEDAVHASGDTGVMALAVRQDSVAALAANGDYIPLSVNATGHLRIEASGSGVTNLGKAAGASYTFGGEVGTAMMTLDQGTLTWQPVLSNGNVLQVGGNVVATAVTPGTGATNLGKAEDAVHATGDVGVMALAVRNDSGAVLAGATGDYIPLTTNSVGALRVFVSSGSIDVSSVVPGVGQSNLGKETESTPYAAGDTGVAMLCVRGSDSVYLPPLLNNSQHLVVSVNDANVSSVIPGTGATNLGKAEDNAHVSGDTGVMMLAVRQDVPAALAGTTGDYAPLSLDALGRVRVIQDGGKITYRASTTAPFSAAAGAAMFFVIAGSSTKTVVVQRIRVSGMRLTTAAYQSIVCERWSTAPTGGTSTALTKIPNDANDAAATANLVQVYTAAPTEGTLVGAIGNVSYTAQSTTVSAAALPSSLEWRFQNSDGKGEVLRGTAQCISLAFDAAPATATTMSIEVEWTEE